MNTTNQQQDNADIIAADTKNEILRKIYFSDHYNNDNERIHAAMEEFAQLKLSRLKDAELLLNRTPNPDECDARESAAVDAADLQNHFSLQLNIKQQQIDLLKEQLSLKEEWIKQAIGELNNHYQKFKKLNFLFENIAAANWPEDIAFRMDKIEQLIKDIEQ